MLCCAVLLRDVNSALLTRAASLLLLLLCDAVALQWIASCAWLFVYPLALFPFPFAFPSTAAAVF